MTLKRKSKEKDESISNLKRQNQLKDETIEDLKKQKRDLNKKRSKEVSQLKREISDLKEKNTKLKEEKNELLSSSSWKVTQPLRKLKYSTKKIIDFKNDNDVCEDINESPVDSISDDKDEDVNVVLDNDSNPSSEKNDDSSSKPQNNQTFDKLYKISIKDFNSPLNHYSYKIFIENKNFKRINLFFENIDDSINELNCLFSFLISYCNKYGYCIRIIYDIADFEVFKDFIKKYESLLPEITFLNLKKDNYLNIGFNEKFVCISWKNAQRLLNSPFINQAIYFYLGNFMDYSQEELFNISKVCYNPNVVILYDNTENLDELKNHKYSFEYEVIKKIYSQCKNLYLNLSDNLIYGIEMLNYLFLNVLIDDDWDVYINSKQDISKFYPRSKFIITSIYEKIDDVDLFIDLSIDGDVKTDNMNYIKLCSRKDLSDIENALDIRKDDEMEVFNNDSALKYKNEDSMLIDEVFKRLNGGN